MTDTIAVKADLMRQLRLRMEDELAAIDRSAANAYEGATHADAKAENKYDTRGLEASYLAGAQMERAGELTAALQAIARAAPRAFAADEAVGLGALVELAQGDARSWCFLVSAGAGYPLLWGERPVVAITPQSPLGRALLGKESGDEVTVRAGQGPKTYEILSVL